SGRLRIPSAVLHLHDLAGIQRAVELRGRAADLLKRESATDFHGVGRPLVGGIVTEIGLVDRYGGRVPHARGRERRVALRIGDETRRRRLRICRAAGGDNERQESDGGASRHWRGAVFCCAASFVSNACCEYRRNAPSA